MIGDNPFSTGQCPVYSQGDVVQADIRCSQEQIGPAIEFVERRRWRGESIVSIIRTQSFEIELNVDLVQLDASL